MKKAILVWVGIIFSLSLVSGFAEKEAKPKKEKKKPNPAAMFKKKDVDGDGTITWEEFKGDREGDSEDRLRKVFDKKDTDASGGLSAEEFTMQSDKGKKKAGGKKAKKQKE